MTLKNSIIRSVKRLFGIPQNCILSVAEIIKFSRIKYGPKIWKHKISTEDIISQMKLMGLSRGSCILIQSSWGEMYNYRGTERELIDAILKELGPEGTLLMPAIPIKRKNKCFDVRRSVTSAGMLAEAFRRYPGVIRSIDERHSVCGIGPLAHELLGEHHLGSNCWDEKSPYYKLSQYHGMLFTLGLGPRIMGTIAHCIESILRNENEYYASFFEDQSSIVEYIDYDGNKKCYETIKPKGIARSSIIKMTRLRNSLKKEWYNKKQISNLWITSWNVELVLPYMINCGRKGINIYIRPSMKGYKFDK